MTKETGGTMIQIRKAEARGHFDHGWLDTFHTFSFADYHDTQFMGFRKLRVINEDRVAPGRGFDPHSHQNMEIITYILSGAVEHQDSMGNKTQIRAGEVQRMSAGTGVTHSEYNPSDREELHLIQIWIFPDKLNLKPGYEQRRLLEKRNELQLVASPNPKHQAMNIHQDAELWAAIQDAGNRLRYPVPDGRFVWVQALEGSFRLNGLAMKAGDGASVTGESALEFEADASGAEWLLFNLA